MSDEEEIVLDANAEAELAEAENLAGDNPESDTPTETADEKAARLEKELEKRDKAVAKLQSRIKQTTREKNDEMRQRMEILERKLSERTDQVQRKEVALDRDSFASDDEYVDARARAIAKELREQERVEEDLARQRQSVLSANEKREKLLEAAEAAGDFDRDEFIKNVLVTPMMAETIIDSSIGDKIILHLNENPEEASRIAGLSLPRQAVEIGKLEDKLLASKPSKSGAPAPIKPLSGSRGSTLTYHKDMSDDEFDRWTAQQHKLSKR